MAKKDVDADEAAGRCAGKIMIGDDKRDREGA